MKTTEQYSDQSDGKDDCKSYNTAIPGLKELIKTEHTGSLFNGGIRMSIEKHNYLKAIDCYTKALETSPDYKQIFCYRGNLKFEINDFEGAIDDFTQYIIYDPKNGSTYYHSGIAKIKLEDNAGALMDFTKAGEFGCSEGAEAIKKYSN